MVFSAERTSGAEAASVALLAAVTIAAVSWRIGNPALWFDEHFSLAFAQEAWTDIFGRLWSADTHRPLYYALLKAWMSLVGEDQGSARLFGAILAGATVPSIWALGRVLGGARVGILAAAVVALSPLFIAQARELRMYSLFTLALVLAALAVALIVKRNGGWLAWLMFAAAAAVAFYAQATGVLLLPLTGLALVILVASGAAKPRVLLAFAAASILWLILVLPGIWPAIFHTSDTLADFWIPEPTLGWVWSQLAGAYPYPGWSKPIVLLILAAGFYSAWRADKHAFWLLLVLVVGTPLLLLGLSFIRPILIVRVFVWTTAIGAVVMAFAISMLGAPLRIAAVAAIVVLQLLALRPYYPAEQQVTDIDRLHAELDGFNRATDTLVLGLTAFEPNLRRNHPWLRDVDLRSFSHGDRREAYEDLLWSEHLDRGEAATMRLDGKEVWLVWEISSIFPVDPADEVVAAIDAVRARGKVLRIVDAGQIRLEVIELH